MSTKLKQLETSGRNAIRTLRENQFKLGEPFMINSKQLPTDQCYLEYPDGLITLVTLSKKESDLKVIATYSTEQSMAIRKQFNLS